MAQGHSISHSFDYHVADDQGDTSNAASRTNTINGVNDAPIANDDRNTMTSNDATVTGNVLGNGIDLDDGAALTVDAGSAARTNGTLELAADGSHTYTLKTAGVQHLAQACLANYRILTRSFGASALHTGV